MNVLYEGMLQALAVSELDFEFAEVTTPTLSAYEYCIKCQDLDGIYGIKPLPPAKFAIDFISNVGEVTPVATFYTPTAGIVKILDHAHTYEAA